MFCLGATAGENSAKKAPTADDIVKKANLVSYYAGNDGRAQVKMTIEDSAGRKRERSMTILRKDGSDGGDQKFFVYFSKPADVRNMTYLVWKHVGGDDDRWLYQPGLDLVKRIAASDKRTSFVGSHFLYEDISGRGVDEDTHELLREEAGAYVLRNKPKDAGAVEFSHYDVWIDKNSFMPMKAEYYDKKGKKYRVVEALAVKTIQGHPTVTKSKASDLASGGNTVSEFSGIGYDVGTPETIFTERYLRRAPIKWLK
jgi:outer membrane lipoprotein-sorting protein